MKCLRYTCLVIGLSALIIGCSSERKSEQSAELTVYVAASMAKAIQEAAIEFQSQTECTIHLNSASSGALANQLLAAPRADLFFSANENWMDQLQAADRLQDGSRQVIAQNRLILVGSKQYPRNGLEGPAILCQGTYQFIAIGAPQFVPAGQYAKTWLENLKCPVSGDLWQHVKSKIIRAPDATAVIGYVKGSAQTLGMVYYTDFLTAESELTALYEVPMEKMDPIHYSAAVINGTDDASLAESFLEFLTASNGRSILESYGFQAPQDIH